MAILKGGILSEPFLGANIRIVTFSGTVELDATGVIRHLIGYKKSAPSIPYETDSDGSGNWSLTMPGSTHDKFMIIAVGNDGENSEIYDGLSG